jgi:hypothetical protein
MAVFDQQAEFGRGSLRGAEDTRIIAPASLSTFKGHVQSALICHIRGTKN